MYGKDENVRDILNDTELLLGAVILNITGDIPLAFASSLPKPVEAQTWSRSTTIGYRPGNPLPTAPAPAHNTE